MQKRSLFLAMAAGLLGSFAFATPSQAGMVLVPATVTFGTPTSTKTLTEIDITYSGLTGISGVNGSGLSLGFKLNPAPILSEVATVTGSGDEIKIKFAGPVTYVTGSFSFDANQTGPVTVSSVVTTPSGGVVKTSVLGITSIPEPSSMALLGIGMTSFLAFRRLFKRTPIA
jgi:hypothetical protein